VEEVVEADKLNSLRGIKYPVLARVCILCAFAGGCTGTALGGRSEGHGGVGVVGGDGWWGEDSAAEADAVGSEADTVGG
jgi:hypothetical protein